MRSEPAAAWEVEGYDAVAEDAVRAARSRDALACALTAMRLPSNPRPSEVREAAEHVMGFWLRAVDEARLEAANAWLRSP